MSACCHIVCAGPSDGLDIALAADDMLIAADGGYVHCIDAGLEPTLYIGDLDSIPAELASAIACARIELPREKDDTDTIAACKEGLKRGYAEFRLHAALGGDVGHELANIQTLAFLRAQGAHGTLLGNGQQLSLVGSEQGIAAFAAPQGTRVSVFAYGGSAQGVILRGLHWELDNAELSCDMPIGVSNYVENKGFEVSVREGALLIVVG